MEGKYIFAIVILGIFFVLILISLAILEFKRKSEAKLIAWISERYADKDLNKFDYDTISAEEEAFIQSIREEKGTEMVPVEELKEEAENSASDAYGKIEVEGIEEITGNYDGSEK